MQNTDALRKQIAELVSEYAALQYADKPFEPGISVIPPLAK